MKLRDVAPSFPEHCPYLAKDESAVMADAAQQLLILI
jgi:hypothetical protein